MENEHSLVNPTSFKGEHLLKEKAKKWNRTSIVGNIGFDMFCTNYVDGFNIKRKFMIVNNSGPEVDSYNFWSCIWESRCKVIVRFDRTSSRHHWLNNLRDDAYAVGEFLVWKKTIRHKYYTQLQMTIKNKTERESRTITHFQYRGCLDQISSVDATQLILFLKMINKKQDSYLTTRTKDKERIRGPIVIHSVSCFERALSICVLDICLDQLINTNSVSVPNAIINLKSQVFFEFFSFEAYKFINKILLRSIQELFYKKTTSLVSDLENASYMYRIKIHGLLFKRVSVC